MITQIEIDNFRTHEHTVLDFHPGVNALIGRGQAGKTNVKRSLEWVKDNRPSGKRYVSWWAEDCKVVVTVRNPDGLYTITMEKHGNVSPTYTVMAEAWDEPRVFEKMGTKVPDLVKAVLNLDAVNIQEQLDLPYLVAGNTGDISRAVNRVLQLEEAELWLSDLKARGEENKQQATNLTGLIQTQQATVTAMEQLPVAESCLIQAELADTKLGTAVRRAEGIRQLVSAYGDAHLYLAQLTVGIKPVEDLVMQVEAAQEDLDASLNTVAWIEALWAQQRHVDSLQVKYDALRVEYANLLEELGLCPFCLSPVDEHTIQQIQEEYR